MKVLTAAQMREVDRRTISLGIPGLILMENAGCRVVDFLAQRFAPLEVQRIVVFCGKGNNGGDGLVVARQLYTRFRPADLSVVLAFDPAEFQGDAADNYQMLRACGCPVSSDITPPMRAATLIVDALLGTGLQGPASGRAASLIQEINSGIPLARVISVDVPSGLHPDGASVRADHTITFTTLKVEQVMPPTCDRVGELILVPIGSPPELYDQDPACWLSVTHPSEFRRLFAPRPAASHKGNFGHVLVLGGAPGKGGAVAMAGLAALRAGAGLVTVALAGADQAAIASLAPELMTQPITADRAGKDVLALGPGLGQDPEWVAFAQHAFAEASQPMVVDADALNALADSEFHGPGPLRVLTPHPGEMARLIGRTSTDVQSNRLPTARSFAMDRKVVLVLKGQRTVIAFPDGRVWINPTGSPAMATAGSGDVLTGLLAGLLGQFPDQPEAAILAGVWLHGRAGELGAATLTEPCLIATDLLRFLPEAIREVQRLPNCV
jgi:ADP-dependent NAD(P)H-hydrate dehydratase / NAD(P)H-hydrate epimerase